MCILRRGSWNSSNVELYVGNFCILQKILCSSKSSKVFEVLIADLYIQNLIVYDVYAVVYFFRRIDVSIDHSVSGCYRFEFLPVC